MYPEGRFGLKTDCKPLLQVMKLIAEKVYSTAHATLPA